MNKVLVKVSKKELENLGYAGFWKYNGYLERFPDFIILAGEIIEENSFDAGMKLADKSIDDADKAICKAYGNKSTASLPEEELHLIKGSDLEWQLIYSADFINKIYRYLRAQEKNQ